MPETTFTELRNHAKAWFDLVEAGQISELGQSLRFPHEFMLAHPADRVAEDWDA